MCCFQGARVHVSGRLMYGEITDQQGVSVIKNQIKSTIYFLYFLSVTNSYKSFWSGEAKDDDNCSRGDYLSWEAEQKLRSQCLLERTTSQVQPKASSTSELQAASEMDLFLRNTEDLLLLVIFIQFYFHVPQHSQCQCHF